MKKHMAVKKLCNFLHLLPLHLFVHKVKVPESIELLY